MKRGWVTHLLVLCGYFLLSILFTWPLLIRFCTALPGEGTDSWQYLWNFWWFDQALFHGRPLYFTTAQYAPLGTSLLFHTLSPLHSLIGLPARALGGYMAAYNSVVLLSTVLSGYGVFLLTLEVLEGVEGTRSRKGDLAAFLAGATFALCAYRSVHLLGHLSLVATETLPFFALFCLKALRRPGWRPAAGIALSWLAAAAIDWYYPFYMVLLAGGFGLWAAGETLLGRRSWPELRRAGGTIAAGLLGAILLLSPQWIPMLRQARSAGYLQEPLEFPTTYGADLLAFVLPSPLHPLWGDFFHRWTDGFGAGNTAEGIVYLGLVPLALGGVGLWRERRAGKLWGSMAGISALLALGPYLKVLNHLTAIPLPYWLLQRIPIADITRVPSRYAVLTQLALAVLAGLGLHSLLRQPGRPPAGGEATARYGRHPWAPWLISGLLLGLVVLENLPIPYPYTPAEVPPFYQQLGQESGHHPILELPLQQPNQQWYYTDWMLYQTVHGRDSFRGYISRGDPLFPFSGAPLFRQLAQLAPASDIHYDDYRALASPVLSYYQVEWIVLERDRLEDMGRLEDARWLVGEILGPVEPAYEDADLIAYAVPQGPLEPFVRLGQGWHEVEGQSWGPFRWIQRDRAEVVVILPQGGEITLEFLAVSFLRPRRLQVLAAGEVAAEMEITTAVEPYRVQLDLPAGETRLEWRAEGYDVPERVGVGADPRELSVGVSSLGWAP